MAMLLLMATPMMAGEFNFGEALENFYSEMGFTSFFVGTGWKNLVMLGVGCVLLYLAIKKEYEPLLLLPIAFGMILTNLPGAGLFHTEMWNEEFLNPDSPYYHSYRHVLAEGGLLDILYIGVKAGIYPCLIFLGVGAMTDFGPLIANPKSLLLGAAAQLGIFATFIVTQMDVFGFTPNEAASIGIIGGADGPTAIFTTIKLAPHLLGPIAIAAYSYMALVPVIIPLVVKCLCSKKELMINMKEQDKLYPDAVQIKNMRVLKIVFPIAVTTIVAIFVPTAVSLVGMLMFGNLLKEIGNDTFRLFDAASNGIMNAATIFLGLCVGATMTVDAFINVQTLGIVAGGFCAFALSIASGICMAKVWNLFAKKKINPLIGATGLSAVPMASRVCNGISTQYDPKNHVLNYCMSSNISGVIGSAVAAGVLISYLG